MPTPQKVRAEQEAIEAAVRERIKAAVDENSPTNAMAWAKVLAALVAPSSAA